MPTEWNPAIVLGCLKSVDWTTGLDYWTGLLDWPLNPNLTKIICLSILESTWVISELAQHVNIPIEVGSCQTGKNNSVIATAQ